MRTILVTAILLTGILAGCTSKSDGHGDHKFTCQDGTVLDLKDFPDHDNATFDPVTKCPPTNGGNGGNNTTGENNTSTPNLPPVLMFRITNSTGADVNNTTMLLGHLLFSGEGTHDPDGTITGMAMSITDSNGTKTYSLYDDQTGTFPVHNITFDRAGRVRVSVAVVDDRGGFETLETMVYVDESKLLTWILNAVVPANTRPDEFPQCRGPVEQRSGSNNVPDTTYFSLANFDVRDNATWIEAIPTAATGTSAYIGICGVDPDGPNGPQAPPSISNRSTGLITTHRSITDLPPPPAADGYSVGAYRVGGTSSTLQATVIVHYGPRPA